jgi:glycine cleavage system H lipoate-binding protein/ABC-type phosphate transport system substrate-binding protein
MQANQMKTIKMKKLVILFSGLLLIVHLSSSAKVSEQGKGRDSLKVLSTSGLYGLSSKWCDEYTKLYPDKPVKTVTVDDPKLAMKMISAGSIAIVSGDFGVFGNQETSAIVVGRDVIVPIINSKNPFSEELSAKGVSQTKIAEMLKASTSKTWGSILNSKYGNRAEIYIAGDESLKSVLSDYIKSDAASIKATELKDSKEVIARVQKDPYAIGFCKMINIVDFNNQALVENIRLLPVDRNGNGTIDFSEKIYDDFNNFSRGVWIGKYPKALFSNIYSISSLQPKSEAEAAFMKWVLTDGQQYLYDNGYSNLLLSERVTSVDKINTAWVYTPVAASGNSFPRIALIVLVSILMIGLIINLSIRIVRRSRAVAVSSGPGFHSVLTEKTIRVPKGLYFDKSHTWAFMDQDGVVKVGVDDFMQHVTGPITRIKMKGQDTKVKKGEAIMSIIQNGKQLNLYAPVSGRIIERNQNLDSDSTLINSSPYNEGWVYKIEPDNWNRESQLLFMAEKEKEHIKEDFARLRDFLAMVLNPDKVLYAMAVLQDGGELSDGVLCDFGPEIWDDFQTKFIDPSRQVWFYEII